MLNPYFDDTPRKRIQRLFWQHSQYFHELWLVEHHLKQKYKPPFDQKWHIERIYEPELRIIFDMVQKKRGKSKPDFANYEFYNCNLSREEKEAFLELLKKPNTLVSDLATVLESGFKISITWDENNNTVIVSTTCRDETSPNYGKIVTSRHAAWDTAVLLAAYKIHYILGYGAWSDSGQDDNWG